jgi:hypothetical protein
MEHNSVIYGFEVIIIISVIIYQVYHSVVTYKNIVQLKDVFNDSFVVKTGYIEKDKLGRNANPNENIVFIEESEDNSRENLFLHQNIVRLSITEATGNSETVICISKNINNYLVNNHGAPVNFSIIRDIIEREVDIKDEEISQATPIPLYLGLAATMVGIIFGLLAMPKLGGANFSEGIDYLIQGVRLAMLASLMGLSCTTILSSFLYRDAKKKIQRDKSDKISYLQAELLPELTAAEDTGISGLKTSFDRFSRNQIDYTSSLHKTSEKLENNYNQNLEIIEKLNELDVKKASIINLDLLRKLEKNMNAFNEFSSYLTLMGKISTNLNEFALRTTNIDSIVNSIDSSLKDSNQLTQYLTTHFKKIELIGNSSLKSVDLIDSAISEAIDKLKENIDNRISNLNKTADIHESDIKEVYTKILEDLGRTTSVHISQFQEAYSTAVPQFQQLDNLEILPSLKEQASEDTNKLITDSTNNTDKLVKSIDELKTSVNIIRNNVNNQAILERLDIIDRNLKNKGAKRPPRPPMPQVPKKGLLWRIAKIPSRIFRNRKKRG